MRQNQKYLQYAYAAWEMKSFWEVVDFAKRNNFCYQVGCTTCGCMELRRFCAIIGSKRLREFLKAVTLEELTEQYDLDWHDILEIIIHDFGSKCIEDTVIYREYQFVFTKYYEARRVNHLKPWDARYFVLRLMRKGGSQYIETNDV